MAIRYYKSDFTLMVDMSAKKVDSNTGEQVPVDTSFPFEMRFFSDNTNATHFDVDARDTYMASWDGASAVQNCKIVDDTHVMVYFDHNLFQFGIGRLLVEVNIMVPDVHFEGDQTQNIKRLYTTGYILTDNADEDTDENIELILEASQMAQAQLAALQVEFEASEERRLLAFNQSEQDRTAEFNRTQAAKQAVFDAKEAARDLAILKVTEYEAWADAMVSDADIQEIINAI